VKGRRFADLAAMVEAIDQLEGAWRVNDGPAAGWYCTQRDEEDGVLDLFFVPPTQGHGLCTIPLEGERGWSYSEGEAGLSVTPSIWLNKSANPPGWHGFLTNGEWQTV
jgi:hypothetical protein